MVKKVFLHVGLHKTGTTSIQGFLGSNKKLLKQKGVAYFKGKYVPDNHVEIALSVLRDIDAPVKSTIDFTSRDVLFSETRERVASFLSLHNDKNVVISNETISFIRCDEEIQYLKKLFPESWEVVPIIILRDKNEWFNSFKKQMLSMGVHGNRSPHSCGYFENGTWLLDHDKLVGLLENNFNTVLKLDYQKGMVKLFLNTVGIENANIDERYHNRTWKKKLKGILKKLSLV